MRTFDIVAFDPAGNLRQWRAHGCPHLRTAIGEAQSLVSDTTAVEVWDGPVRVFRSSETLDSRLGEFWSR